MTLTDFRRDKKLMAEAQKLHANPVMQRMLEIIAQEHVMYQAVNSVGLPGDSMQLRLGQIEGYNMCLEKFRLFFEDMPEPPKDIKATFRPQKL